MTCIHRYYCNLKLLAARLQAFTIAASQNLLTMTNPTLLIRSHCKTEVISIIAALLFIPGLLFAHGDEVHNDPGVSVNADESEAASLAVQGLPENISNIGGPFSLINHSGQSVSEETYAGKHMLVFFGYSNCQVMCSISLRRIADALSILQADSDAPLEKFNPLVITVDPEHDTPERLRESLSTYHSALIGLTGSLEQLKPVYKAYGQKPSVLELALNGNPIVSHSSYFFLMGPDGKLQTFFPPILSPESMAALIKKYLPA